MLRYFIVYLLVFAAINPSYIIIEAAKRPERKPISTRKSCGIRLRDTSSIQYFLTKLENATSVGVKFTSDANVTSSRDANISVTVRSDVYGVKVSFTGFTQERCMKDNKRERLPYRSVFQSDVITEDKLVKLERFKRSPGKNDTHIVWRMRGYFDQKDITMGDAGLKALFEKRSSKKYHRNSRPYILETSPCLSLPAPTECFIYWHRTDGIIGLAIDTVSSEATMYQAEWKTIATKTQREVCRSNYAIRNTHFNQDRNKNVDYFIELLQEMKTLASRNRPKYRDLPSSSLHSEDGQSTSISTWDVNNPPQHSKHMFSRMEEDKISKHSIHFIMN